MEMLAKVAASIGTSLLTEKFVIRMFLIVAEYLAKSSKNDLDDQLVEALKENLKK